MLKLILNLFRKPQPTAILQNNTDHRDWSVVKTACSAERFKARREKHIGIVNAIQEHVDEEFRAVLWLFVACLFITFTTTTPLMGQTMQEQKACYDQAKEYTSKEYGDIPESLYSVESHIMGSHCYVRVIVLSPYENAPNNRLEMDVINDAFTGRQIALWSQKHCYVNQKQCGVLSNHRTFNNLLYAKFPAFNPEAR